MCIPGPPRLSSGLFVLGVVGPERGQHFGHVRSAATNYNPICKFVVLLLDNYDGRNIKKVSDRTDINTSDRFVVSFDHLPVKNARVRHLNTAFTLFCDWFLCRARAVSQICDKRIFVYCKTTTAHVSCSLINAVSSLEHTCGMTFLYAVCQVELLDYRKTLMSHNEIETVN